MASEATVKLAMVRFRETLTSTLPNDIELAAAVAVFCVESGPYGMDPKNPDRPIIRFEIHKFYELYGHINEIEFAQHFGFNSKGKRWEGHKYRLNRDEEWKPLHTKEAGQQADWEAFFLSHNLSAQSGEPAIEATSWGAPQIMGFHYRRLGFQNAFQFMRFMYIEKQQIVAFVRFITSDTKLYAAIRALDFASFARIYNGSGQIGLYADLMQHAYKKAVAAL